MKILKKHLNALEKIFAAEIEGKLPFQSKSQIYDELAHKQYLEKETIFMYGVRVTGYFLTHKGRITYCKSCKDKGDSDE